MINVETTGLADYFSSSCGFGRRETERKKALLMTR